MGGYVQDYVQDERYIAREHMDVRRDCVSFARLVRRVGNLLPTRFPLVGTNGALWITHPTGAFVLGWDQTVRYE